MMQIKCTHLYYLEDYKDKKESHGKRAKHVRVDTQ
jgi:hypothetical protein